MSFLMNPMSSKNVQIEINQGKNFDSSNLYMSKTRKTPLRMIPSIYEPPQQIESEKQQSSWGKSTNHTNFKLKVNNFSKYLQSLHHTSRQLLPHQKINILKQILQDQQISPNTQFIWKLLPSTLNKEILNFQEGDCISFDSTNNQRMLILSGQIRITGKNSHKFKKKSGFIFFLTHESKLKQIIKNINRIKEIVVIRSTKILKIPDNIYQTYLKNYILLKNSQKIKFIRYCPFFVWRNELTQDLGNCMQILHTEKQQTIYSVNTNPESIYFVKQGIVLLERNKKISNPLINDYEMHYEKNQITEKDVILVVRKGMAFGIDGIIIKDFDKDFQNNDDRIPRENIQARSQLEQYINLKNKQKLLQNPQNLSASHKKRKSTRIYTAKTLGKCQLFVLDKKILQTLFSVSDVDQQTYRQNKQISHQQLQRMSRQYTNMIFNHTYSKYPQIPIKKKDLILKIQPKQKTDTDEFSVKKSKSVSSFQRQQMEVKKPNILQRKISNPIIKSTKLIINKKSKIEQLKDNQGFYEQFTQKARLKNQVKLKHYKQLLMGVRKSITIQNRNPNQENPFLSLPKITLKDKKSFELKNQKQSIDDLINLKIKQQATSPLQRYQCKDIVIGYNNYQSQGLIGKQNTIIEQQPFRRNPTFFNIKSYKSIIIPLD